MHIYIFEHMSWIGRVDTASHYSGKIYVHGQSKFNAPHYVTRKLTASEAKRLNQSYTRYSRVSPDYVADSITEAYLDLEELVADAIKLFQSVAMDNSILLQNGIFNGDPKRILAHKQLKNVPQHVMDSLNALEADYANLHNSNEDATTVNNKLNALEVKWHNVAKPYGLSVY